MMARWRRRWRCNIFAPRRARHARGHIAGGCLAKRHRCQRCAIAVLRSQVGCVSHCACPALLPAATNEGRKGWTLSGVARGSEDSKPIQSCLRRSLRHMLQQWLLSTGGWPVAPGSAVHRGSATQAHQPQPILSNTSPLHAQFSQASRERRRIRTQPTALFPHTSPPLSQEWKSSEYDAT